MTTPARKVPWGKFDDQRVTANLVWTEREMSMSEDDARKVSELLRGLDRLGALLKALRKPDREFYMCAQSTDECLYGDMTIPASSGIVFVESFIENTWKELGALGVTRIVADTQPKQ
jgi:hypothetical protein